MSTTNQVESIKTRLRAWRRDTGKNARQSKAENNRASAQYWTGMQDGIKIALDMLEKL